MDIRSKPYYKYLPAKTKQLLNILYPEVTKIKSARRLGESKEEKEKEKALERKQFIESYKPQKSFTGRFTGDIKTLLTSLPKIPGAMARTLYETDIMQKAGYDVEKPFWSQAFKRTPFTPVQRLKMLGTTLMPDVLPASVYKKMGIPYSPRRDIFRKLYLDSLIKGTGKWLYKPKERLKEYKEHPFLTPMEDIMNIVIPLQIARVAPIGLLSKTALGKAVGKTKFPTALRAAKTTLAQRSKFANIISEMKGRQFIRTERLRTSKFKKALEAVPKSRQVELEALLTRRATPWKLTPEVKTAYKLAERSATIETKSLIAKGLLSAERHKGGVWKDLTKEFGKSIDDLEKLGIKEPVYYPHTFAKYPARPFPTIRKRTPSYLKTKMGVKGWEEPYISIPKHKIEYYTQKTSLEAMKQVEKTFGKTIGKEGLLSGYVGWKPKGYFEYFKVKGTKLVGVKKATPKLQIPKFIDEAIRQTFASPSSIEKFFKMYYDPLTNTWKMSVLALSPRWIFNNIMGNFMLNVAGAVGPGGYIKAIKAFAKARKAVKTQGITFERAMMRQHVSTRAWKMGIYGGETRLATPTGRVGTATATRGSWLTADKAPVMTMWKKLGYKLGEVPRAMYKFNSGVEAFFRTAHYLDKIGKPGFNSAKAIASVNEFLFDYGNMSGLQKSVIRRIDPFWAWHKNIIRLTVTYPIKYPVRFGLLKKAQELVSDEKRDYRFLPEYLKSYEELPFGIGGEQAFLSMRGMNPFADIMAGISALHPALKIPIERETGVQLWKGKPFTSPYQQYYGAGEKVIPPLWRHIISQFPHAKLIETMFKPYAIYSTGEPILDKEGQIKYQKSRLLEVLKMFGINITTYDLDQMYEQGVSRAMREQTTKETYQEKLEKYRTR